MKIGIGVSPPDHLTPNGVSDQVAHAVLCDRLGYERFAVSEHMVVGPRRASPTAAAFPFPLDSLWPDPLVVLSAVAALTSRIRLATAILVAPLRTAINLAKAVATLDSLSGGRLDLGLGTGWMPDELEAASLPRAGRYALLEDSIGACRALWTQSPASYSSPSVSFAEVWCRPAPAQVGGPPILLAGPARSEFAQRVARLADGWIPQARPAGWQPDDHPEDEIIEGVKLLRRAFSEAGRDPNSLKIQVSVGASRDSAGRVRAAASLERAAGLAKIGVTHAVLRLPWWVDRLEDVESLLRAAAERFELNALHPAARRPAE
jgi:probable F420-dependent oxidoreductase